MQPFRLVRVRAEDNHPPFTKMPADYRRRVDHSSGVGPVLPDARSIPCHNRVLRQVLPAGRGQEGTVLEMDIKHLGPGPAEQAVTCGGHFYLDPAFAPMPVFPVNAVGI